MGSHLSSPQSLMVQKTLSFLHYELWVNLFQKRRALKMRRQAEYEEARASARIAGIRRRIARENQTDNA
jgi:hypothetical protein